MNLAHMSACGLKELLSAGETSCREIMQSVLDRIGEREGEVQAFISVRDEGELLSEAEAVDQRRQRGEEIGPLAGLPVAIKDNICTTGIATTCASRMLEKFVPPYDATVVSKIRAADGIILGKTNMDEFAMGSSTETSAMKTTRNPHNPEYVPGGTSGGSAAAVAAHETILAVGSDTGGSIRQPASFCGVVGMKPTYGRVSRYGLIAYASSLDQIGTVTKDVRDTALLLAVLAGHDPLDSTSIDAEVPDYVGGLSQNGRHYRIGVPREYFGEGLDDEVRAAVEGALKLMEQDGHTLVPVSLPHTQYSIPTYYILACAEASSNLARYDGCQYGFRAKGDNIVEMLTNARTEGFGDEVKRRIMLGTYVLSAGYYDAYYLKAMRVRTLIAGDFEAAFETCDVIAHPVAPTAAFKIGEKVDDPLAMYLGDIYSVTANLAGIPAISIPCGRTKEGLPIGIQLAAKALDEGSCLLAGGIVEQAVSEP